MTTIFNTARGFIRNFVGPAPPSEMDVDEPPKSGLFAQCSFALIRTAAFTDKDCASMASELRLHDGEVIVDSYPETRLDLHGLTHVISTTYDFPDYNACCDALIPVVKPTWVQHSLAKDKLSNPRQYNPDPRLFMSDVVACVSDLPEGDADAIAGGVLAMGGLYSSKLTSQTTHIISLDFESDVCLTAQKKKIAAKIVLPHWVDDCLKLGRKIDEQPYLLPDAEILLPPTGKAPSAKRKTQVEGATDFDPAKKIPMPATPRKLEKVFKKKTVMLANDLGISQYLRGILDGMITTSGGKLTDSVSKANMYICKYREGSDYRIASRAGKDVGNLAWLFYLITTDEWTSPLRRLLHYPVAREGLAGFPGLKISLSNYSGEARTYLENLIIATGAECTKTLKQDNTHLVTAHVLSEKCAAAKDWNIHIVNHLWIEESYAKWKMQSITEGRYVHFPKRTNLGDIVGNTQLDRKILEQNFFPETDVEMVAAPEPAPMRQVNHNATKTYRGRVKASDSSTDQAERLKTPAPTKFSTMGKENITPSTTNSRKSKDVASARLHDMTPDMLLYEKERKRVGGVVYGGRRKKDPDRVQVGRKRSVSEASENEATDDSEAKRARRGNPPPQIHLMISGYTKWVGHPKVEDSQKKLLRSYGIMTVTDARKATHLAAPHIVRTQKFVISLAYGLTVISTDFIDECLEAERLLDPDDFLLEDGENEKKLGVSLKLSRERAKENRNQLLQGLSIYCMESIPGGFDTYKAIVEANGGTCMLWRNRKNTIMPSTRAESEASTDTDDNVVYLLSDEKKDNRPLWNRFKDMAHNSRKSPRILSQDWLLETAMSQKLLPTAAYDVESGKQA